MTMQTYKATHSRVVDDGARLLRVFSQVTRYARVSRLVQGFCLALQVERPRCRSFGRGWGLPFLTGVASDGVIVVSRDQKIVRAESTCAAVVASLEVPLVVAAHDST